MPASRRFAQLDVFADRPGLGNALAVVIDAHDLDAASMQALAHWTNLSETAFLLPPTHPQADYRVRIFTPRQELPFAGHPSVGSAHAAIDAGLASPRDGKLVQECAAGLLPVRIDGEGSDRKIHVRAPTARLITVDAATLPWAEALGDAAPHLLAPPVLMDNGPRWWLLELANEAAVRTTTPALDVIARLTQATGAVGVAVFARAPDGDAQVVVRAFCPADGIPEDPVTGSANAAIGAWLAQSSALPARSYTASQGREIGRDGKVVVTVDDEGEVWIGGATQTVVRGSLTW